MSVDEIKQNRPSGATHYAVYQEKAFYFFKSSFGFRQIKGNIIQFDDANMDSLIKPL